MRKITATNGIRKRLKSLIPIKEYIKINKKKPQDTNRQFTKQVIQMAYKQEKQIFDLRNAN